MVPLRVFVKGFLSYREGVELTFDGAPLWVLTGRNGAGKSAIFDAITFALYGYHRGGGQNYTDLINHACDDLLVEFDFRLDTDEYRIRRTVSRRGQGSRQIFHLGGPNAPNPAIVKAQMVPETGSDRGFRQWVSDYVGLDYRTFTASVVLMQGKSDELLNADPALRHKMLSELVDLSVYERLHNRAKDKYAEYRGDASRCQRQIDALPSVGEEAIDSAEAQIEELADHKRGMQMRLNALAALKVHAERWEALQAQQLDLQGGLQAAQTLLDSADKIENNHSRFLELSQVLPRLEPWFDAKTRTEVLEAKIESDSEQREELAKRLSQEETKLTSAASNVQSTLGQLQESSRRLSETQDRLNAIQPEVEQLKRRKRLQEAIAEIDDQLQEYPPTLDQQIGERKEVIRRLHELQIALPWLEQFSNARSEWQMASKSIRELEREQADIEAELEKSGQLHAAVVLATEELAKQFDEAQQSVVEATTLHKEARASAARFQEVKGASKCHYCGQPLTSEHREAEQQRLNALLSKRRTVLDSALSRQRKVEEQRAAKQIELEEADGDRGRLNTKLDLVNSKLNSSHQAARNQEENGLAALKNLPQQFSSQIRTGDPSAVLMSDFPSSSDIYTYQQEVAALNEHRHEVASMEDAQRERDKLLSKRQHTAEEFVSIDRRYTQEEISALRDEYQAAEGLRRDLIEHRGALEIRLDQEQASLGNIESERDRIKQQLKEIERSVEATKTTHQHLKGQAVAYVDQLPESWQSCLADLSSAQLRQWQQERADLESSKQLYDNLIEARQEVVKNQATLANVLSDLAKIPDEAQCSPDIVTDKIAQKQLRLEDIEKELARGLVAKEQLVNQRDERAKLEQELLDSTRKAGLYRKLASLLGRDNLQRFLLQQVEAAIVENANAVLDHISGGDLCLELRGQSSTAVDTSSAKALDIIAYNRRTGSVPMSVAYLSGSQRFRVAVSLALGIGRYVSRDSKRIESVIIDEGFGGLDHDGRRDMISELHLLKGTLKRIILVSHQEEFAHSFENGYEITLLDGVSSAELMNLRYQA